MRQLWTQAPHSPRKRNFYVDNGLLSVVSKGQAIQLVKEAKELCTMGRLWLHMLIPNNKEVIVTIPKEQYAEAAKDLDMALGKLHMERALGVQWCMASDSQRKSTYAKRTQICVTLQPCGKADPAAVS